LKWRLLAVDDNITMDYKIRKIIWPHANEEFQKHSIHHSTMGKEPKHPPTCKRILENYNPRE